MFTKGNKMHELGTDQTLSHADIAQKRADYEAQKRAERQEAIQGDPATKAFDKAMADRKAEAEAKAKAEAKAREDSERAARDAVWAERKQRALHDWQSSGGQPEDFETAWPAIKEKLLTDEVLARQRERADKAWRPLSL